MGVNEYVITAKQLAVADLQAILVQGLSQFKMV
ncbi:hypothetical protein CJA_1738 [Cellvibrio japonicus Ueda107]|uniref:Uncharacterized protein n=1 Tax=Cellvibrio japonicus (strain Ueda107) TaxID=498211 RepID=B3PFM6_CELJU|nr:hypothetical protein CJA_1738 [Cellvibrio japonicus Ueda107]